jgi:hypothetical protein
MRLLPLQGENSNRDATCLCSPSMAKLGSSRAKDYIYNHTCVHLLLCPSILKLYPEPKLAPLGRSSLVPTRGNSARETVQKSAFRRLRDWRSEPPELQLPRGLATVAIFSSRQAKRLAQGRAKLPCVIRARGRGREMIMFGLEFGAVSQSSAKSQSRGRRGPRGHGCRV